MKAQDKTDTNPQINRLFCRTPRQLHSFGPTLILASFQVDKEPESIWETDSGALSQKDIDQQFLN